VTSFGRVEGVDAAAQTISKLGDRLGPVRIKVLQARDDGFLRLLLDSLEPTMRWALDFRHESWHDEEIQARLDERGVARVDAEKGGADFRYLRLRNPPYTEDDLKLEAAPLISRLTILWGAFRLTCAGGGLRVCLTRRGRCWNTCGWRSGTYSSLAAIRITCRRSSRKVIGPSRTMLVRLRCGNSRSSSFGVTCNRWKRWLKTHRRTCTPRYRTATVKRSCAKLFSSWITMHIILARWR